MNSLLSPVVLCGSAGSRLWPVSRQLLPKQFRSLVGDGSLIQQTVGRLGSLPQPPMPPGAPPPPTSTSRVWMKRAFEACPAESVDCAVMERTSAGAVVIADIGWTDVGSWDTLWAIGRKDELGNVVAGDVALAASENCYVRSDGGRLVSVLGLSSVVVVDSDDALLVAHRSHSQDVKKIVEKLHAEQRSEALMHRRVYRPWGFYQQLNAGENFQAKLLMVKPGCSISLQLHHRRAEHWVVVSGTARVTRGNDLFELFVNQSTYIPIGTRHRLENPGAAPLLIVEVQSGAYLGEDDIVRFEDHYGRVEGR